VANTTDKQSLLTEIRESEGKRTNFSPLAGLIRMYLECLDSQQASSALARALSVQGSDWASELLILLCKCNGGLSEAIA
jgi:hypothetical protein